MRAPEILSMPLFWAPHLRVCHRDGKRQRHRAHCSPKDTLWNRTRCNARGVCHAKGQSVCRLILPGVRTGVGGNCLDCVVHSRWGNGSLVREGGTVVSTASVPWCPSHAGKGCTFSQSQHREIWGCSPPNLTWEMSHRGRGVCPGAPRAAHLRYVAFSGIFGVEGKVRVARHGGPWARPRGPLCGGAGGIACIAMWGAISSLISRQ